MIQSLIRYTTKLYQWSSSTTPLLQYCSDSNQTSLKYENRFSIYYVYIHTCVGVYRYYRKMTNSYRFDSKSHTIAYRPSLLELPPHSENFRGSSSMSSAVCRWLVIAVGLVRAYLARGSCHGLYYSIEKPLKFFQTGALLEVSRGMEWAEKVKGWICCHVSFSHCVDCRSRERLLCKDKSLDISNIHKYISTFLNWSISKPCR